MGGPITLEGADTFARTLKRAGRDLANMSAEHTAVSRLVSTHARTLAPRRTGSLAGSLTGEGQATSATITATAPHARPIHSGVPSRGIAATPFLTDATRQTHARWLAVYYGAVTTAIRKVRGL